MSFITSILFAEDIKYFVVLGSKPKVVHVPQNCPFRDDILKEVEELKRKKEEEKLKQRALWKEEREKMKRLEKEGVSLEGLVANAEMKQKVHEAFEPKDNEQPYLIKKEGSLKAYYREFKKVIIFFIGYLLND